MLVNILRSDGQINYKSIQLFYHRLHKFVIIINKSTFQSTTAKLHRVVYVTINFLYMRNTSLSSIYFQGISYGQLCGEYAVLNLQKHILDFIAQKENDCMSDSDFLIFICDSVYKLPNSMYHAEFPFLVFNFCSFALYFFRLLI